MSSRIRSALGAVRRLGWALAALMVAGLAACGPDTGAPEASSGPSAANTASGARASIAPPASSAAVSVASQAAAPVAVASSGPACPKVAQPQIAPPQCPPAALPNALAAPVSKASRRVWTVHCGCHRHRRYVRHEARYVRPYQTHEIVRSESVAREERVIERAGPVCPQGCPAPGYRTYDYAGIDARGYLVWPGKVEY